MKLKLKDQERTIHKLEQKLEEQEKQFQEQVQQLLEKQGIMEQQWQDLKDKYINTVTKTATVMTMLTETHLLWKTSAKRRTKTNIMTGSVQPSILTLVGTSTALASMLMGVMNREGKP